MFNNIPGWDRRDDIVVRRAGAQNYKWRHSRQPSGGDQVTGHRLLELKVEVNRECPLHCLHCSSNGAPEARNSLHPRRACDLVSEFAFLGGESVCISGGEPLFYGGLWPVIASCQRAKVNISLYTTGIMRNGGGLEPLSQKAAALLAEKGVKTIFSIHGASEGIHDRVTGMAGSFETTVTAIERAISAGIDTEVHVVPIAMNFDQLVPIAKLVSSLMVGRMSWLRFVPQGRGLPNRAILQLRRDQLQTLAVKKAESERLCPGLAIRMGAPFNILCPEAPASCEAATRELTIGPDGVASPCDAFKRFRVRDDFSSVLDHSLSEIWQRSYLLNAVRAWRNPTPGHPCVTCSFFSTCSSGCLAQKAIAAGTLNGGRDPDCILHDADNIRNQAEAIAIR